MQRRHFLTSAFALGCGRDMQLSPDIGIGTAGGVAGAAPIVDPYDPRVILGDDLFSWHVSDAEYIHISPTLFGFGSSPPTVTLDGDPDLIKSLRIAIDTAGSLGTARFKWAPRDVGGVDLPASPGVPQWTETGVLCGTSVPLGDTGARATFSAGTYATSHYWQPAVERWNAASGADCVLDNSTVTASPGVLYEINAFGALSNLPAVHCAPGMLGNQGALGAFMDGNREFHVFAWVEASTLASPSTTLCPFAWSSQTSGVNDRIEVLEAGSTASVAPDTWGMVRVAQNGTAQRANNTGKRTLAPIIMELSYDLTTANFLINRFPQASMGWSGIVRSDRFTIGGHKLGINAATLFEKMRFREIVVAKKRLSESLAEQVALAR